MTLSLGAKTIIDMLTSSGYEAYAVGGCVRDCLMGRSSDDIDITTSATPLEMEQIFNANSVRYIETGIKHGTITVVSCGDTFEVTTYRTDGSYLDSRHPESVEFVRDLKEDLARRDFTINALAYNEGAGIVDEFGGQADIKNKIIRAVGNPDKRFKEDALRIMRALRFASVLDFDIESKTKKALLDNMELLKNVSRERIYNELSKLLMGSNVYNILVQYKEIFGVIIPELVPIFNIEQNTKWHIYDVWCHTAKSVECAPDDLALRYIMLLHDIGKAFAKQTDENGTDHFKGHQKISADYADVALKSLKVPNTIYDRAMAVIPIHDIHIGTEKKNVKKWLSRLGEQSLRDLIEVKRADKKAQNPALTGEELARLDVTEKLLNSIIIEGEPFTIKDLSINGNDLKALGYEGKQIGALLDKLLNEVINESIENTNEALIKYVKGLT